MGAFSKLDTSDLILRLESGSSLVNQSCCNLWVCPPVVGGVTNLQIPEQLEICDCHRSVSVLQWSVNSNLLRLE